MKILMMGGTRFLGLHTVNAALAQGHEVTLFNRGKSNPSLFAECEQLRGDRLESDLSALKGRAFDAVIDTSAYIPRVVTELLQTVETTHYSLVSSISVYADNSVIGQDESAEVSELDDPTVEEVTGDTYGGLKVLCERAADALLPDGVLHVRSGLIVGPDDPTDRFTYWPARIARGGEVLAPLPKDYAVQVVDVRDQAEWIVRMAEQNVAGYFNVTGPNTPLTMGGILQSAQTVSGASVEMVWVEPEFLLENEVQPWGQLPLWIPGEEYAGFSRYNVEKAVASGLTFRPIADTIRDHVNFCQCTTSRS